ncbi:hypothetical protein LAZ44_22860 [Vibrio alginolyticus]|uniref:hypothetical protein n=1 Tax=Vibrio TaxID=662 RepID=UPI001CDD58C3|nr:MULTISPECIES: hypothetical protein [Vibrio]MCA2452751.1 hypothetical protein [Vibrio alginolyticus]MDW2232753.1 hypothetical protein [Vibrio sp. 2091]
MFILRVLNLSWTVAIVRPATVLFIFLLAAMVLSGGPEGFSRSFLNNIKHVVSLGPAPQGFINLESCDDERLEIQNIEEMPKTVNCENIVVEQVPMDKLSKKFGEVLIWCYFAAAMLGNLVAFLFNGFSKPWGIGPARTINNLSASRSSEGE